ncbi:MAG: response regulator [Cyanosarcina radialis HA8281-LM2]|jgi:signal transduction histidine kinase|nr:response regulator [Cyanosarcina radialis HA8281-LM2]
MTDRPDSILVVDDIPTNIRVLVELLSQSGFKVAVAKSGKNALEIIDRHPPNLILLDIMMPEMDGFEICRRLKTNPHTQDIPVVFMSALDDTVDKVKGLEIGAVDYITKPIVCEEALARIRVHLQLQKSKLRLVEEEKMAALGRLVAGVAHEINTPIGAIQASISNITAAIQESIQQLPQVLQQLTSEQSIAFFQLVDLVRQPKPMGSWNEERQFKRSLKQSLAAKGIAEAEVLAALLSQAIAPSDLDSIEAAIAPLLETPNPVFTVKTAANFAIVQNNSENIQIAVERASKIVFALRSYARQSPLAEMVSASVTDGIETVLAIYQNQLKRGIEQIKNYQPISNIPCYPDELMQVWSNLISNAIQAMNYRGKLTIAVAQKDDRIVVEIGDTGPGIPPEIQAKIFEPFFTTKPLGEGSGLGLSIVRQIIERHRGQIDFCSQPGHTRFSVWLPANDKGYAN